MEERNLNVHLLAESHAFVATAAYGDRETPKARFVEAMGFAIGEAVLTPTERARWLPRSEQNEARLRKGKRRLWHAMLAAHIASAVVFQRHPGMTLHRAAQDLALVLAEGKKRHPIGQSRAWSARTRGTDVIRDIWRPQRSSVHLAIPLALAGHPAKLEISKRHPDLVALAVPDNFADLITNDRWARQAMQVAAMWRWHLRERGLI